MDGIYYVIRNKKTGETIGPPGVSGAPHLYTTRGKAEGRRKSFNIWFAEVCEVVPVQLTEIKE